MEIYSKGIYPANSLSNFAEHHFEIDGVRVLSMEGFLQSLKFRSPKKQRSICLLTGKDAKSAGKRKFLWKLTGVVFWNGKKLKRISSDFDALIDRAYSELYKNEDFKRALADSLPEPLTHDMGKSDKRKTILTKDEFISQLIRLRGA